MADIYPNNDPERPMDSSPSEPQAGAPQEPAPARDQGNLGPGYEVLGDINPKAVSGAPETGGAPHAPTGGAVVNEPLSPADERTWSMVAHLSILVNLFTGFLGPVVPLIIYLIYKDRSRYVAYQSMQAFIFQLVWWVGGSILAVIAWTISGILVAILIGCLLMPLALLISLIPLAALAYGVYGAIETNQGHDFQYWLIGKWVRELIRVP